MKYTLLLPCFSLSVYAATYELYSNDSPSDWNNLADLNFYNDGAFIDDDFNYLDEGNPLADDVSMFQRRRRLTKFQKLTLSNIKRQTCEQHIDQALSCFPLKTKSLNTAEETEDKCLTFSADEYVEVMNYKQCTTQKSSPPPKLDTCTPENTEHQCFHLSGDKIFTKRGLCLTVLNDNYNDFANSRTRCGRPDNRHPACQINSKNQNYGGRVVFINCDFMRHPVFQTWTLDHGVIKSNCNHEYKLAMKFDETESYLVVAKQEDENTKILHFGDDILEIPKRFPSNVMQIASEILNDEIVGDVPVNFLDNVFSHGCWCSRLGGQTENIGGKPVDELDQVCSDWARARKCIRMSGGTCFDQKMKDDNYQLFRKYDMCPFNFGGRQQEKSGNFVYEEFSCGNEINQINSDNLCNRDLCLIDKHYVTLIKEQLILDTNSDIISFIPKNNYQENGCKQINIAARDARIMLGIDNLGKLDEEVDEIAAFDRMADSWMSIMGLPTDTLDDSNPKDTKVCTGQAPLVTIKSLEQLIAEGTSDGSKDKN